MKKSIISLLLFLFISWGLYLISQHYWLSLPFSHDERSQETSLSLSEEHTRKSIELIEVNLKEMESRSSANTMIDIAIWEIKKSIYQTNFDENEVDRNENLVMCKSINDLGMNHLLSEYPSIEEECLGRLITQGENIQQPDDEPLLTDEQNKQVDDIKNQILQWTQVPNEVDWIRF